LSRRRAARCCSGKYAIVWHSKAWKIPPVPSAVQLYRAPSGARRPAGRHSQPPRSNPDSNGVYIFFTTYGRSFYANSSPGRKPCFYRVWKDCPGYCRRYPGNVRTAGGGVLLYAAYPVARCTAATSPGPRAVNCHTSARIGAVLSGLLRPFMVSAVIALTASLLLALWLARSVYRPLGKWRNAANRVAKGDYSYRIILRRHDEAGKLANSFDQCGRSRVSTAKRSGTSLLMFRMNSRVPSLLSRVSRKPFGTARHRMILPKRNAARIIEEEARRLRVRWTNSSSFSPPVQSVQDANGNG